LVEFAFAFISAARARGIVAGSAKGLEIEDEGVPVDGMSEFGWMTVLEEGAGVVRVRERGFEKFVF
jgi:hypothetical protein